MVATVRTIHVDAVADVAIKATAGGARVHGVAYNGGAMRVAAFAAPVVVDLEGVEGGDRDIPLLIDHQTDVDASVGTGRMEKRAGRLHLAGTLNRTPEALALIEAHKAGRRYQLSIGLAVTESHDLEPGGSEIVNGQEVRAIDGPVIIVTRSISRECSFVALGADNGDTQATIEARHAQGGIVTQTATQTATQNDPVAIERERVKQINARVLEHQTTLTAKGAADLAAQAIEEGWGPEQVDARILNAYRTRAEYPPLTHWHQPAQDRPQGLRVQAAAALMMGGQTEVAEKHYNERELQAAADLGITNGVDLAREAVRLARGAAPTGQEQVIQAAFSTATFGQVMQNATEALLIHGYRQAPQDWRQVARTVPVKDFAKKKAVRPYTADSLLEQVGPDGELKHTSLGEAAWDVQADTYGRIVGITRQDIINDGGLGGVFEIERSIGLAAGRTLNKAVWKTLRDSSGFFATGNKNLLTGSDSALAVVALSLAVAKLREQKDDGGEPIDLQPACLAVPPALEATARQLLNSMEVEIDGLTAANPWRNLATLAVVPYLAASAGGGDGVWYLGTRPSDSPALLVALLNGQDRPVVEQVETAANMLGIQLRAYFDFGVSLADPKAMVRSNGQ